MPTICIFDGIKILMYYRDHLPPHFHAERGDEAAEIGIDPIQIIQGQLERSTRSKVFEWAAITRRNCAPTGNWRVRVYPFSVLRPWIKGRAYDHSCDRS